MHLLTQPRTHFIERAVQALLLLNVADAVFTSWWVSAGWATEANPLMAHALAAGVGPFIFVKVLLGTVAVLFLRAHSHRPLSRVGIVAALVVYTCVLGFHLSEGAAQYDAGTLLSVAN